MRIIQTALIFYLGLLNGFSQTEKEKIILSKLDNVEVGDQLDTENSWFTNRYKEKISYEAFKGEWLLIDFWSTGCIPCIKEFPALDRFYKNNKDKIKVITVSVDKEFKTYQKSIKKYKINLPSFYSGFTYNNSIFNLNIKVFKTKDGKYKFRTVTPQYVLINPEGVIIDKDFPKPSSKEFETRIKHQLYK